MTKQVIQGKSDLSVPAILFSAFFLYSIFSVTIGSPILGPDEYAYLISGKYYARLTEIYQLDDWIQRVPNILYLKWIHVAARIFGSEFVSAYRILHAAEYVLSAFILFRIFEKIIDRKSALWGMIAFLLLPSSFYIYPVMPETELTFLTVCIGYLLIVLFPCRQFIASVLIGLLIGAGLLIKPHTVAILAAVVLTAAIANLAGLVKGAGRGAAIRATLTMLGACYFSFVVLLRICSHQWSFNPLTAFGLFFYGQYLQASTASMSFANKAASALMYSAAHSAIIFLIFAPALICMISFLWKKIRIKTDSENAVAGLSIAALLVLLMLASHVAMTSWFTAGAVAINEGEAMRLHGRYLGPVIAFLPFLYFHAVREMDARRGKLLAWISLATLAGCFVFVFPQFKILPWDHPLLFAFFRAPNHYGWDFSERIPHLGAALFWGMAVGCLLMIVFERLRKPIVCAQIFAIFLIGSVQTYVWAFSHTRGYEHLTEPTKAIRALVGKQQFGKGVFVSDERYERAPYILFTLANSPKIVVRKPRSVVTANDVAGADWVVFANDYVAEFNYRESVQIGALRFFPLNTQIQIDQREKKFLQPGDSGKLLFNEGLSAGIHLKGFNIQETWGAWTSSPKAEIELPFVVQGEVRVKFFGWTLPENRKASARLSIGDASSPIALSDVGKEFEFTVNVFPASDRLIIESPVFRAPNSAREMGIAIRTIMIERR